MLNFANSLRFFVIVYWLLIDRNFFEVSNGNVLLLVRSTNKKVKICFTYVDNVFFFLSTMTYAGIFDFLFFFIS